jgi:hypothetical protein
MPRTARIASISDAYHIIFRVSKNRPLTHVLLTFHKAYLIIEDIDIICYISLRPYSEYLQ